MTKVLYVATRPPIPVTGGRERMILQSLKFIARSFDLYFVYFDTPNSTADEASLRREVPTIKSIKRILLPPPWLLPWQVISRRNRSFQERLYYSSSAKSILRSFVSSIDPDVVVCDMLRTSQYFENIDDCAVVVDLDDLLSVRYRRFIKANIKQSFLGTYANRLPRVLGYFESMARKWILAYESRKIEESELRAASLFSTLIMTSRLEARLLNQRVGREVAFGIPPSYRQMPVSHRSIPSNHISLGFIGNIQTAQNLSSLIFIVSELLPILAEKRLEFCLLVCGELPSKDGCLLPAHPNMRFTGYVDNVQDFFDQIDVALLPVTFGTGIKTKVLDALSRGVPTITNSVGAEGLDVEDGKHLIVRDEPAHIAEAIIQLSRQPELCALIAQNGIEYVAKNHSEDSLSNEYRSLLLTALERRGCRDIGEAEIR